MSVRHSWQWAKEYLRTVRPNVVAGLQPIRQRALVIPDPLLRAQALSSLNSKQFHCEGGGVFSGPSRDATGHLLAFLLPYQTLCDYLDTVTDRGPSKDPDNLRQLHQALQDAIEPGVTPGPYYALHPQKEDGGYASYLVKSSQEALTHFPGYGDVFHYMRHLVDLYVMLQVNKHGPNAEREPRLTRWLNQSLRDFPLDWWELAAATGSTLGLFALLNVAQSPHPDTQHIDALVNLYLPWLGALHILLDYYVDQEEDEASGDLNFVRYYPSPGVAVKRIRSIYQESLQQAKSLPDGAFHQYIAQGLLGFYLSDPKVRHQWWGPSCRLLASGGPVSLGIYVMALSSRSP